MSCFFLLPADYVYILIGNFLWMASVSQATVRNFMFFVHSILFLNLLANRAHPNHRGVWKWVRWKCLEPCRRFKTPTLPPKHFLKPLTSYVDLKVIKDRVFILTSWVFDGSFFTKQRRTYSPRRLQRMEISPLSGPTWNPYRKTINNKVGTSFFDFFVPPGNVTFCSVGSFSFSLQF